MTSESTFNHSPDVSHWLDEFSDVMLDELPDKLPLLRDIQHTIDLVLRSQFPNLPRCKMNPLERTKLNRQIKGLLVKAFVHHSLSPYVVPVLLNPKKDGT